MQRMISIPLQSTSTINIHVPLGELMAQQQQKPPPVPQHVPPVPNGYHSDRHHVTRMSVTSNGSSVISISPPSSPHRLSRSSSRSSAAPPTPVKPNKQSILNGNVTKDETFETDSAMGSSQDDSRSIHSTSSNGDRDVGFNSETSSMGIGADVENNNREQLESGHCAVAVFMDKDLAVLVKATCQLEAACVDQRFVATMLAIIKACGLHLKKNPEDEEFNAVTVNKMKLHDARPAKEHIAELSRELESSVTIRAAIFRRMNEKGREHVGTLVNDVVKAEGNCTVAKVGCLVELRKSSKYAPAREFADQLCEHIYATKPTKMGSKQQALELQKLKTNFRNGSKFRIPKDELLSQTFIFDPTINIAEAARRSFVEVVDFVLYE